MMSKTCIKEKNLFLGYHGRCTVFLLTWYTCSLCNVIMWYTYSGLYPLINKLGESLSYMTVFIGLNGTKEELGIQAHNCWSFTRYSSLHGERWKHTSINIIYWQGVIFLFLFLFFIRPDLEQAFQDYIGLPLDKVRDADVPMMFVSFPSAKDPTWHARNPGMLLQCASSV